VVEGSRIRPSIHQPRPALRARSAGKPLRADYVLEYRNTKLGVVEAKAGTRSHEGVGPARTTRASWRCATRSPPTGTASTASDVETARRGKSRVFHAG